MLNTRAVERNSIQNTKAGEGPSIKNTKDVEGNNQEVVCHHSSFTVGTGVALAWVGGVGLASLLQVHCGRQHPSCTKQLRLHLTRLPNKLHHNLVCLQEPMRWLFLR